MLFQKNKSLAYLVVVCSLVTFMFFGYCLERSSFATLILAIAFLFSGQYLLIYKVNFTVKQLFAIGMLFRVCLLFAIPNLSQDFYRFIWDGRMIFEGNNPYITTPLQFMDAGVMPINQAEELCKGMGKLNASHFTNYPPLSQLCYWLAALFGSHSILASVVVFKLQIILADVGVFYFGKKILAHLKLPLQNIFLYFLNPFIIIELTGNLHFEAVMVCFLVWSMHLLLKGSWKLSAVVLALSVSTKLLPLLFLPVLVLFFYGKKTQWKNLLNLSLGKYILYCGIVLGIFVLSFLPFFNFEIVSNFSQSIGLWFQNFEFNASIYYMVRWIGYQVVGWNIIGTAGKVLPLFVILGIAIFSLGRRNYEPQILFISMLWAVCLYLALATTVHPWYLSIPLILSTFTKYRFAWLWSALIFLSYHAYAEEVFQENLAVVALEYALIYGFLAYELFLKPKYTILK